MNPFYLVKFPDGAYGLLQKETKGTHREFFLGEDGCLYSETYNVDSFCKMSERKARKLRTRADISNYAILE